MNDETPTIRPTNPPSCSLAPAWPRQILPGTNEPITSDDPTASRRAGGLSKLAEEIAWHQALLAVEWCQRVAELAARR
jgi:hypothetical protein